MIDWKLAQGRLRVVQDNKPGPLTYAALLTKVAGTRSTLVPDLAASLSAHVGDYAIDASPQRLAGFVGQTCHESMNFTRLKEMGGDTYFTNRYDVMGANPDKALSLGNTLPGDGAKFCGRGAIQLTGRNNYRACAADIGLNLLDEPELLEQPSFAMLAALWYWRERSLNGFCDVMNWKGLTKAISGSETQGYTARLLYTNRALEVLLP